MFKERSTKKRIQAPESAKESSTLDARHKQAIATMQERRGQMASLKEQHAELARLRAQALADIEAMKSAQLYDTPAYDAAWSSNLSYEQQMRGIQKTLDRLENLTDEIEYYENTGYILYRYYDILQNQGSPSAPVGSSGPAGPSAPSLPASRPAKNRYKRLPAVPSRNILEALSITPPSAATGAGPGAAAGVTATAAPGVTTAAAAPGTITAAAPAPSRARDKSTLVEEYLAATDQSYIRVPDADQIGTCASCKEALICLQQEGVMVCPRCGYQELLLVEQNRPILRISEKDQSNYSYKRLNHMREWISQIQGKESTDIPEEVYERILAEIRKEKLDPKQISFTKMREILKKLRINKYYEHCSYLLARLAGQQTPQFPPELEERLCALFKEIQVPFVRHCPKERKNFLSYAYVLRQLCMVLGYPEYAKFFPMLKSREKRYAQDQIFSKICADLGWPFYPSV